MRRPLSVAALALLLAACATRPPPLAGAVYAGKLAVRCDASESQPARSVSGQFELSGSPASGQLVLTSPIGTTVARARWSHPAGLHGEPSEIELEADGRTARFDSLDAMMQQALGDSLPLAAMFDWLAGRPWPDAPAARGADGLSFEQLGWRVDLSQFAPSQLITAERPAPPPTLHVRVKLEPAEAAASAPH
jgi:outer membrane lipoprotein LolB